MTSWEMIATILVPVMGIAMTLLGLRWAKIKKFVITLADAIEDDEITRKELQQIIRAARDMF